MEILGGLALFLYGITIMSEALKTAASGKLKPFLSRMVSNKWKAMVAGAGITALIQSSSVTTVLAVGFVSAGILQFQQTIGIILGASIGSTITSQIIAFKITNASLIFIAVGFVASAIFSSRTYRSLGQFLLGLGFIFMGMSIMGEGADMMRDTPMFAKLLHYLVNPLWSIAFGLVMTAIVQSSTATIGVAIMLISNNMIDINSSIAIVLGANIGTSATALASAIGKPRAALQVAMAHVLFKVAGSLLWVMFIPQLADMVVQISPNDTSRQIANSHTIMNVANAFLMIGFSSPFARLVKFIVPDKESKKTKLLPNLDPYYLSHVGVSLDLAHNAIDKLGKMTTDIIHEGFDIAINGDDDNLIKYRKKDSRIDEGHTEVITFIRQLQLRQLAPHDVVRIENIIEAANILESAADAVTTNLVEAAEHRTKLQFELSDSAKSQLLLLYRTAEKALSISIDEFMRNEQQTDWTIQKNEFKELTLEARKEIVAELSTGNDSSIDVYKFETEMIEVARQLHQLARRLVRRMSLFETATR